MQEYESHKNKISSTTKNIHHWSALGVRCCTCDGAGSIRIYIISQNALGLLGSLRVFLYCNNCFSRYCTTISLCTFAQILPRNTPSRSLRSSSSITISAPLRKTLATSKSFSFTASHVWNKLPTHVSSALTRHCLRFQKASQAPFFPCMPTLVSLHQP